MFEAAKARQRSQTQDSYVCLRFSEAHTSVLLVQSATMRLVGSSGLVHL